MDFEQQFEFVTYSTKFISDNFGNSNLEKTNSSGQSHHWQSSNITQFPLTILLDLNGQFEMGFLLLEYQTEQKITEIDISNNDLKVDLRGCGSQLKIVLRSEYSGLASLSIEKLRIYARSADIKVAPFTNHHLPQENNYQQVQKLLLKNGIDLLLQEYWSDLYSKDLNQIIDAETADTLRHLLKLNSKFTIENQLNQLKSIRDDIREVVKIGQEIFGLKLSMEKWKANEQFDQLIKGKLRLELLIKK